MAWAHVEAVIDLVADLEPTMSRAQVIEHWELALPLVAAFSEDGDPYAAQERAALVLLGVTLPEGPLREVMKLAIEDPRARVFLGVHEASGVRWLSKERFEELARFVSDREAVEGRASVALTDRQVDDVAKLAAKEGYRADAIAKALVADVKLEAKKPEKAAPSPSVKR
ncbi:MAG: Alpha-amylase family protein [Labilithrix sp.]|nr:Alpha-amylase family protein [Labilithrix sp.]